MAQCLVILLYLWQDCASARFRDLPPMSMPQQLLPDGARFVGAGLFGERDAYLYAVDAPSGGEMQPVSEADGALRYLLDLARADVPQDFALTSEGGAWVLTCRDLDPDVY